MQSHKSRCFRLHERLKWFVGDLKQDLHAWSGFALASLMGQSALPTSWWKDLSHRHVLKNWCFQDVAVGALYVDVLLYGLRLWRRQNSAIQNSGHHVTLYHFVHGPASPVVIKKTLWSPFVPDSIKVLSSDTFWQFKSYRILWKMFEDVDVTFA